MLDKLMMAPNYDQKSGSSFSARLFRVVNSIDWERRTVARLPDSESLPTGSDRSDFDEERESVLDCVYARLTAEGLESPGDTVWEVCRDLIEHLASGLAQAAECHQLAF